MENPKPVHQASCTEPVNQVCRPKPVLVAIIGAGDRGKDRYGAYIGANQDSIQVVAVAEPNDLKRQAAAASHKIPADRQFKSWEEFFALEKCCDGVLITTSDDLHYQPVMRALDMGYHVLLEKPMSNQLQEVLEIGKASEHSKGQILVCHVLRYTTFYSEIKRLIESGAIGEVVNIQHNENIGYYHFAHSFVRGNWRNTKESSPLILAKSCHDMDLLIWLSGKEPLSVSSYGKLTHFCQNQAPDGSGTRCLVDCQIRETCVYAPERIYTPNIGRWPSTVVSEIQTPQALEEALLKGPYGRCVYRCDNDVVDHQVTIVEFEDGVTASFNLSAFTNEVNRTIKIMGTKGEIRGNDINNEITVKVFGGDTKTYNPKVVQGGHGGGDTGIMEDFVKILKGQPALALTSAKLSVMSHVLSFAAEASRTEGRVIKLNELFPDL